MTYWTIDYFKGIYDQYMSSGLSVRDFCKNFGCDESRFYYWVKKVKELQLAVSKGGELFIPISSKSMNGISGGSGSPLDPPMSKVQNTTGNCCFEIAYPNGIIVRLPDHVGAETVRFLISIDR